MSTSPPRSSPSRALSPSSSPHLLSFPVADHHGWPREASAHRTLPVRQPEEAIAGLSSLLSATMAARSSPSLAAVGNGTAALGSDPDAHPRPPSATRSHGAKLLPCPASLLVASPRSGPKPNPGELLISDPASPVLSVASCVHASAAPATRVPSCEGRASLCFQFC